MSEGKLVIRKIRRYEYADIIKIFSQHVPFYFDSSQEENLIGFLEKNSSNYYVIELSGEIIGGGGYTVSYTRTAFISWVMISPIFQNKGFGSLVLKQVLKDIQKDKRAIIMESLTCQHNYLFFQKSGLLSVDTKPDFWAQGLHLHKMQLKIKKPKLNPYKKFKRKV